MPSKIPVPAVNVSVLVPLFVLAQTRRSSEGLVPRLLEMLVDTLFFTSTIHPNPPVETVHRLTLAVAVAGSVVLVAATGLYYITGGIIGIPYAEIKLILPRMIVGLAFAAVALPVLQFGVQLADALVEAFRPQDITSVTQVAGLTGGFLLVWLIKAVALLALVVLFIIRNVYILFIAAVTPLLAVGWSFPNTRPYAKSFLSTWFAMLAIAPADALVLRFSLVLLEGAGEFGLQPASNWILGIAAFGLMLWVPYQLIAVSMGTIGGRQLPTNIRDAFTRRWPPGGSGGAGGLGDDEFRESRRRGRRDDWDRDDRWRR